MRRYLLFVRNLKAIISDYLPSRNLTRLREWSAAIQWTSLLTVNNNSEDRRKNENELNKIPTITPAWDCNKCLKWELSFRKSFNLILWWVTDPYKNCLSEPWDEFVILLSKMLQGRMVRKMSCAWTVIVFGKFSRGTVRCIVDHKIADGKRTKD